MGHITNPIAMRLKRYGLWQINWSVYFRQEFSSYFTVGLSLDKFLYSFTLLKGFFKRFFFFELKYFLYTSYLMVFVCLKFTRRKTFLRKFKLPRLMRFKYPYLKKFLFREISNEEILNDFLKDICFLIEMNLSKMNKVRPKVLKIYDAYPKVHLKRFRALQD